MNMGRLAEFLRGVKGKMIGSLLPLGSALYCVQPMRNAILVALEEVRATLRLHNGGIELRECDEDTGEISLEFTGACAGCALSSITMKKGVEVLLCERVPGITKIHAVKPHAKDCD